MKRRWLLAIVALITVGAAAGCKADVSDIIIRDAPIHEVRINIAESFPPQISVYIKGGLADGCTTFNGVTVTRQDKDSLLELVHIARAVRDDIKGLRWMDDE